MDGYQFTVAVLNFLVSIIKAVVWPSVIVAILWPMRKSFSGAFSSLIDRVEEADFSTSGAKLKLSKLEKIAENNAVKRLHESNASAAQSIEKEWQSLEGAIFDKWTPSPPQARGGTFNDAASLIGFLNGSWGFSNRTAAQLVQELRHIALEAQAKPSSVTEKDAVRFNKLCNYTLEIIDVGDYEPDGKGGSKQRVIPSEPPG